MGVVPFLILFPMVMACIMFCIKSVKVRNALALCGAGVIIAAVAYFVGLWIARGAGVLTLYVETEMTDHIILAAEILLMCFVIYITFKHHRGWISLFSIVPTVLIAYFDLAGPKMVAGPHIYIDHLSVLMCMIIGLIGSMIIVYATGYMVGYHEHHTQLENRSPFFFALLFLFLGAMFGFVLSENLLWIDFFWEITSVCSFLLITYTKEDLAYTNAFRALWMNLLGGTFLAFGILYYGMIEGKMGMHDLVSSGVGGELVATLPVLFIAFAALTKAAQMPFSTWLLGAMIAPTPSSALLHSATMVKAGIYILFRLSPAMHGTTTGSMVAVVGGFTFIITSFMAIAQSDAKKVLALSTVSNLGLMTACAGMGTSQTIWAGVFLMVFHAISKSLLFQSVGATENVLHSRDIENMHGLLYIVPRLAAFQFIGIAGMFLAPFGMLISKWSALKASVDERDILMVIFICFGSATTSFYWSKWMGKIISASHLRETTYKDITKKSEFTSLMVHGILMIALCVLFPLLSQVYVMPLLGEMFADPKDVLPSYILYTLVFIILIVFLVPFLAYRYSKKTATNFKLSYMNGVNSGDNRKFYDYMGEEKTLWMSNYYFFRLVGIRKLMIPSQVFAAAVVVVMMCIIVGGVIL
ncbi:MAG: NADH-quinone oxidoreductase subunit L [Lachnospiraceae bacterium]|nr:NADH-quinone oxidoreductase subunit L [Lachnospiraceae bacterium]